MKVILLGTYKTDNGERIILYSEREGKCILFKKPRDFDSFLYSYFNKVKVSLDRHNEIVDIENLGPCDLNGLLESIRFASNNLKIINAPRESNVIIYLEGGKRIIKVKEKYILTFNYLGENYEFNIGDESVISYLNKSEDNLYILNKYMEDSKVILVIIKDSRNQIGIVKIHSIKMG